MTLSHGLLLVTCALGFYAVGQVWLVQLSSYPLWAFVGPNEFHAYHHAWWQGIWGVILFPASLVSLGALLMLWWHEPSVPAWMVWLGFGLQFALILGTAIWWGPLMARLEAPDGGLLVARYSLLLRTHWLRVLLVTAYGAIALGMVARTAPT